MRAGGWFFCFPLSEITACSSDEPGSEPCGQFVEESSPPEVEMWNVQWTKTD